MTSAGQTFEGAIAIADAGGRPAISGTLAAETLALEPLLGPPQRLFDSSGGWSAKPFALAPLQTFDLDLRLSAGHLDVYGLTARRRRRVRNRQRTASSASISSTLRLMAAASRAKPRVACVGRDLKLSARGELERRRPRRGGRRFRPADR